MRFAKRDVVLHDADTEAPTGLRVLSGRTLKGDLIVNVNAGKESSVLAYCDLIVYLNYHSIRWQHLCGVIRPRVLKDRPYVRLKIPDPMSVAPVPRKRQPIKVD